VEGVKSEQMHLGLILEQLVGTFLDLPWRSRHLPTLLNPSMVTTSIGSQENMERTSVSWKGQ
jgi:hypothetical protein